MMLNKYDMEMVMRSAYWKILDMLDMEDGPEMEFMEVLRNKTATGSYLRERNIVLIKVRGIKDMVSTLCHELRHSWQHKRYGNYFIRTYEQLDPDDFIEYWECEFEVDARRFARDNYEEVFNYVVEENSDLFE